MAQINKPNEYFNSVLYTGNQTQQTINVGFQPDFVWIKSRNNTQVHALFDAVRGVSIGALQSNAAAAENANQKLVAYTSTGFTLPSVNYEWTNTTGWNFASWNWLASNTTASNTDGSITSTVSANTTSGFSIVKYVGTGSNATIGHGLNTAPTALFVKNLDAAEQWINYDVSNGATKYYHLNLTDAAAVGSTIWNNTAPTTSVFSVGTVANVNSSGANYVAYCFSNIAGFSKIGSYTGNGNADGAFVFTGFKPAFVLIKITDNGSQDWFILDSKRSPSNLVDDSIAPNQADVEYTSEANLDFLSNGFKLRMTSIRVNASGSNYIYAAFAENPFTTSSGIPTTAR